MKKILLPLLLLLLCMGAACAEEPAPAVTLSPTPASEMIAQPDATRRPTQTATPRPADAPLPEDVFLGHAVEIARRLDLMAESSVYYAYCNRSGATQELWDEVSRGDHTTPSRIFSLSGERLVYGLSGGQPENAPWLDLTRADLRRDMTHGLPDVMYVGMKQETVSLCKTLARYKVFAYDAGVVLPQSMGRNDVSLAGDGCGLLVMLYDGGTPVVLPWHSQNGAVSISAFFMPDAALEACQSAEDVAAWFASLGMPLVTFEEVTW